MHIVDRIFEAIGRVTDIARDTGDPIQTVHSWKANGNIPHWRRQAIVEAAKRAGRQLDADMLAYLASSERAPKKVDEPQQAAA